ncbi:MAG: hypothetical protein ABR964_15685 [Tepidisphaeraceae bacterium]
MSIELHFHRGGTYGIHQPPAEPVVGELRAAGDSARLADLAKVEEDRSEIARVPGFWFALLVHCSTALFLPSAKIGVKGFEPSTSWSRS